MMRYEQIRRSIAPLCLAALLTGCGQVESLLVMNGDGASSSGNSRVSYNSSRVSKDSTPSGLSKEDDPIVFLTSAAAFAEGQREYETAGKHWAHLATLQPDNMVYVQNLATSLRILGRYEDAERVLLQALREDPKNIDLTEEMAKTLIASGRLREGVVMIEKVSNMQGVDPARSARLHSATGVAFDRAEKHAEAQAQYKLALQAQPHNASALNNLGLSYAMAGQLKLAETTLRRALVAPSAGTQVRQNLAMVLSLKGNTDEARRLVGQDLPPSLANQTIGFYGSIADQPDAWRDAAAQ